MYNDIWLSFHVNLSKFMAISPDIHHNNLWLTADFKLENVPNSHQKSSNK